MVTDEGIVQRNTRVSSSFDIFGGYFPEALSLVY